MLMLMQIGINWLELLASNPRSAVVVIVASISLVAYLAVLLSNIRHMQRAMVTTKDLRIALGDFAKELNGRYVSRREWEEQHRKK